MIGYVTRHYHYSDENMIEYTWDYYKHLTSKETNRSIDSIEKAINAYLIRHYPNVKFHCVSNRKSKQEGTLNFIPNFIIQTSRSSYFSMNIFIVSKKYTKKQRDISVESWHRGENIYMVQSCDFSDIRRAIDRYFGQ